LWENTEFVVIVDAVVSGAPPGTIHCVAVNEQTLPEEIATTSTHSFGLHQAVELARTLGRLPKQFTVVGIEGASFEHGTELSAAVSAVVDEAITKVRELLKRTVTRPRDFTGDKS
jgi:hydrogenase maturation protease